MTKQPEKPTTPAVALPVIELSACCHAPVGYDAWVDSNGDICGGPYDNSQCMHCGEDDPEIWQGGAP
jgi:hypothetical protein